MEPYFNRNRQDKQDKIMNYIKFLSIEKWNRILAGINRIGKIRYYRLYKNPVYPC